MSTFQFFPNFGRGGGGVIKNQFFSKFKIVHIILGGGGQENYGLFPQFVTFFCECSPKGTHHIKKSEKFGKNSQLGLTPPPRIIQNILNFRNF